MLVGLILWQSLSTYSIVKGHSHIWVNSDRWTEKPDGQRFSKEIIQESAELRMVKYYEISFEISSFNQIL